MNHVFLFFDLQIYSYKGKCTFWRKINNQSSIFSFNNITVGFCFSDLLADGTKWLKEYVLPSTFDKCKQQRSKYHEHSREFKPYKCLTCGKNYTRKYGLHRHVTYECLDSIPLFQCHICPKKFKRKDVLDRHLVLMHLTSTK